MAWVHTWFGLVLGHVLMACFFFGTLSVFDREIDRWALPDTRFAPQPLPSFDQVLLPALRRLEPDPAEYTQLMPGMHDPAQGPPTPREALPPDEYWVYATHRDPVIAVGAGFRVPHARDEHAHNHIHGNATVDPRTGALARADALRIGSQWFYPMHYSLNWHWHNAGIYLVGLAGLVMLVALVSGVILHRRLLREFFTLRLRTPGQRRTLDLHNLTGVLALPFHFFFAFTGLLIFAGFYYFPVSSFQLQALHDQHEQHEARVTGLPHARAGIPAPLASVDAMVAEARRRWAARDMAGEAGFIQLHHVGDLNGYVSIYRAGSDRVALVGEGIHFQASTGAVLHEEPPRSAVAEVSQFLTGLHLQHFEHWTLRWLYVLGGLMGTVCIATGFVFFVEKRRRPDARATRQGSRLADAAAVTTVTGMVLATVGMLVANRLLPLELPAGLPDKGQAEKLVFWGCWALAGLHAAWRSAPVARAQANPAWREQCAAIALLGVAAVGLNAVTTGDHLLRTLVTAPYWPVAGVDLALLATAAVAGSAAWRLWRPASRPASAAAGPAKAVEVSHV
ncbi:PepSY domain-containing protein [Ideonella sp. TBM-1]|uniref:PepSY domain-containing protein n=2 Tax=Ideonella livida TaxID=2707176 RepID=A0A7C9TGY2_9BURK|nr:PepSY domain-containing protein [Ideonella livida]